MLNFRTAEEILRDMFGNVKNTVDKSENSLTHDALASASIEFGNMNIELEHVAGKLDVENLEGKELEDYIKQRTNTDRKLATKSNTVVKIEGNPKTLIREGDLVSYDGINFIVQENTTIDDAGVAYVSVEAEFEGSSGNVPANSITEFPITISGVNSVTNEIAIVNGYDAETDKELLERYYERIRRPITSANKYHYISWAKEVEGVGNARIVPLWAGDNTVKIIIIDSNKQPASLELIETVQEYIDPGSKGLGEGQAPIGAFCTVMSADIIEVNVSLNITKDSNFSLSQIETSIKEQLTTYLKSIAFKKNLISYAHIGAMILDTEGVLDYTNLKINEGLENITVANEEVAILGEVVVSE